MGGLTRELRHSRAGGWCIIFRCIKALAASGSKLAARILANGQKATCSIFARKSMGDEEHSLVSPRSRARHNRRLSAALLTEAALTCVQWARVGGDSGLLPRGTASASWLRSWVTPECSRASRLDPFAFEGDKRGRAADLLDAVLHDSKFHCSSAPVTFRADPREWAYALAKSSTAPLPLVAQRLALPTTAAVVPLDEWLHPDAARRWNNPLKDDITLQAELPRGYFRVQQREWRKCVRRLF